MPYKKMQASQLQCENNHLELAVIKLCLYVRMYLFLDAEIKS